MAELNAGYACQFVDRFNKFIRWAAADRARREDLRGFTRKEFLEQRSLADFASEIGLATEHDAEFIRSIPEEIPSGIREAVASALGDDPPLRPELAYEEGDAFGLEPQRDDAAEILTIKLIIPRREAGA